MPGIWSISCCYGFGVGDAWSCCLPACAKISRVFFVRSSAARGLRRGCSMASGADGFAGLSAARGGGGVVAHPARTPTAIKGIEHRFMIRCRDEFPKTKLDFHSVEIPDAVLDPPLGRCRDSSRNKRVPVPEWLPSMAGLFLAI